MYDHDDEDDIDTPDEEFLPAVNNPDANVLVPVGDYAMREFIAVEEDDTDKQTTIADVAILNNQLALCHAASFKINNLVALCALSNTVIKLIEARRKVKKLQYGDKAAGGGKGGLTVLD